MKPANAFIRSVISGLASLTMADCVLAQLQLPGAVRTPTPAGTTTTPEGVKPRGDGEPPAAPPVMVRAPGDRSLDGRTLTLNGRNGFLRFIKNGPKLELSEMRLTGDRLSKVGESCTISMKGGPFAVEPGGRSEGLLQFTAKVDACPFTFSVLDSAVMVTYEGAKISTGLGAGTCEIPEEDCRGHLAGFWGPPGNAIGPAEMKSIETTRAESEKNVRANFRALIRNARNEKAKVMQIASDQAGFSARREEVCRDYLREHQHGFCASRYTQARAVGLAAQLGAVQPDDETAKPAPRPRRPAVPRPTDPGASGAPAPAGRSPGLAAPLPLQPVVR